MADPNITAVIITSILTTLGMNGIIGVWLKYRSEKKLETHKSELKTKSEATIENLRADLKAQSDREMERFRSEAVKEVEHLKSSLQTMEAQNSFRFSKVFERTVSVIETTYAKLLAMQDAASAYTQAMQPDPDRIQAAEALKKARKEFVEFYRPNTLYVPKATQRKIQDLVNTTLRMTNNFTMQEIALKTKSGFDTFEKLSINVEKLQEEVPKLLEALDDDFQRLFGFPETKPAKAADLTASPKT